MEIITTIENFFINIFNIILNLKIIEAILPIILLMIIVKILGGTKNIILGLLFNTIFGIIFLKILNVIGLITKITSLDVIITSLAGIPGIIFILVKSILF